jgi:hypothetical protein
MAAKDSISETVRNHKKGATWYKDEVVKALTELNVKLDQDYTGSIDRTHWVIFPNGFRKCVSIRSIFSGDSLGVKGYTEEAINEKLSQYDATLAEPYKGSINLPHLINFSSGITRNTVINKVFRGESTGSKKHTQSGINSKLSLYGSVLLEDFKGSVAKKHLVGFRCGHSNELRLDGALKGVGCPECAKNGFNKEKPGRLYFIRINHGGNLIYKLGITNNTIRRRYKDERVNYDVIFLYYNDKGKIVFQAEQQILKEFSCYKYEGSSPFEKIGVKEILTHNISEEPKFLELVNLYNLKKVEYSKPRTTKRYINNSEAA